MLEQTAFHHVLIQHLELRDFHAFHAILSTLTRIYLPGLCFHYVHYVSDQQLVYYLSPHNLYLMSERTPQLQKVSQRSTDTNQEKALKQPGEHHRHYHHQRHQHQHLTPVVFLCVIEFSYNAIEFI